MKDETTPYEQTYTPTVARLDVPLRSVVNLRRVAGQLRALAQQLDFLSREPGAADIILTAARKEVRHANKELQKIRRPGRPKKREHSLRWPHKM